MRSGVALPTLSQNMPARVAHSWYRMVMDSDFSETPELPYGTTIRFLGVGALILMTLGALSGVSMLLLKWLTGAAPHLLSIIPLLALPLAFVALLAALFFTLLRRRTS